MSLEAIFNQRIFESPFVKAREEVGPSSVLWALLFGPVYYWRKQAPVEALIYFLLTVPLVGFADIAEEAGLSDGIDLGFAIWIGLAVAAPLLLARCYLRKGWVEVSAREIGSGADWIDEMESDRYDGAIRRHIEKSAGR